MTIPDIQKLRELIPQCYHNFEKTRKSIGWSSKTKIILDHKKQHGYLLKPKTWCKIKFESNHSILMVFCDREYEYKDYIEKYKNFLKIVKK